MVVFVVEVITLVILVTMVGKVISEVVVVAATTMSCLIQLLGLMVRMRL